MGTRWQRWPAPVYSAFLISIGGEIGARARRRHADCASLNDLTRFYAESINLNVACAIRVNDVGSESTLELHKVLCGNLQPDLTILLDSNPVLSVGRARRRNRRSPRDENRFEQETQEFLARVRAGYLSIAKREPQRVVTVDARGTPSQTHRAIAGIARERLELGKREASLLKRRRNGDRLGFSHALGTKERE